MIAIWKLAPALAPGCTIVVKPAEEAAAVAALSRLADRGSRLSGGRRQYGAGSWSRRRRALVWHPLVDKISFTGSPEVVA